MWIAFGVSGGSPESRSCRSVPVRFSSLSMADLTASIASEGVPSSRSIHTRLRGSLSELKPVNLPGNSKSCKAAGIHS